MGAITPGLLESELFGHVRGAFTDAKEARIGRLEVASGGTLFLDEIGNIGLPEQAKLLRVLEERTLTPVGSNVQKPVDVRLISATSVSQEYLKDGSRFRQDLLYRINTVEVHLPPLRERKEDIPLLAHHFVRLYARRHGREEKQLPVGLAKSLCSYSWPGNVRELRHAVERAVILSDRDNLSWNDFFNAGQGGHSVRGPIPIEGDLSLARAERALIERALQQVGGNVTDAAQLLGITRSSLYRRMEKHDIR